MHLKYLNIVEVYKFNSLKPLKKPENSQKKEKAKTKYFTSNVKRISHVMQSTGKHLQ